MGMGVSATKNKEKPISRASAPKLRPTKNPGNVPDRIEFDQESSSITSLRPPAPLPPTPRDHEVDGWFEQMPTNPAQIPDLGALAGGATDPGASQPAWDGPARKASVAEESIDERIYGAPYVAPRGSMYIPVLTAAVFLIVGMALGAFLYSRLGSGHECPDPAAHSRP